MSSACIHEWKEPEDCGRCRDKIPLPLESFHFKSDGTPLIVLRTLGVRQLRVLQLDKNHPIIKIDATEIRDRDDARNSSINLQITLEKFRNLVFDLGYLFQPSAPLTTREQTEDGPTHCRECKTTLLSFKAGSLGCKNCGCYVCRCGTCMCGFPGGLNYLKQYIPPQPPLNCSPEDRRYYARVAYLAISNIKG